PIPGSDIPANVQAGFVPGASGGTFDTGTQAPAGQQTYYDAGSGQYYTTSASGQQYYYDNSSGQYYTYDLSSGQYQYAQPADIGGGQATPQSYTPASYDAGVSQPAQQQQQVAPQDVGGGSAPAPAAGSSYQDTAVYGGAESRVERPVDTSYNMGG